MRDLNLPDRRLLGTCGWERSDWTGDYYPPDLPTEWRLAYYANDAGCVMLPSALWCGGLSAPLEAALAEAPEHLVLFLQLPSAEEGPAQGALQAIGRHPACLLVERPSPRLARWPQWVACAHDTWMAADGSAGLTRWGLERFDLRNLRRRAEGLEAGVRAVIIDGPGAHPGELTELRILFDLLDGPRG